MVKAGKSRMQKHSKNLNMYLLPLTKLKEAIINLIPSMWQICFKALQGTDRNRGNLYSS
jgi:hypothetical protein